MQGTPGHARRLPEDMEGWVEGNKEPGVKGGKAVSSLMQRTTLGLRTLSGLMWVTSAELCSVLESQTQNSGSSLELSTAHKVEGPRTTHLIPFPPCSKRRET